ncbi:chromosomal replication initiator DnaA [Roseovarius sp. SCSIO 43702]|uniref:chromosomal replication initiator DnaA n=1 Tax=Roseovarius sp. SCSIO 43702 TaxID=2823043 RepID=UPI001C73B1DD|nr:chromosomal replication initiator DnaA [Roseovarius sp. SCSIO 43702]QYX55880.1 chromosomal replication initiator DnaA [Roseovarius sp. SCSIO 43702]
MADQLSFDLPARPAMGRDAFFVSGSNAAAVAMIEGWQDWPARKLMLRGPEGSGKSHLAHVWAGLSGASIVASTDLAKADIPALAQACVAVEDIGMIAGDADSERALFHLHNLVLAEGHSLLLTTRGVVPLSGIVLPDLASRLEGTPEIRITEPDDDLLAAVLMKLFSDKQLRPAPETIPYLVPRIPRSFATLPALVQRLDRMALDTGRPINRRLAAHALDNWAQ